MFFSLNPVNHLCDFIYPLFFDPSLSSGFFFNNSFIKSLNSEDIFLKHKNKCEIRLREEKYDHKESFKIGKVYFYERKEVFQLSFRRSNSPSTTNLQIRYVQLFLSFMAQNTMECHRYLMFFTGRQIVL